MKKIIGTPVSKGFGLGTVRVIGRKTEQYYSKKKPAQFDRDKEVDRLEKAILALYARYEKLKSSTKSGSADREIVEAMLLLLSDTGLLEGFVRCLEDKKSTAEAAVICFINEQIKIFQEADGDVFTGKGEDFENLKRELLDEISEDKVTVADLSKECPCIVVSESLSPADILEAENGAIAGIMTAIGSEYSHTVILARMNNIPMIMVDDKSLEVLMKSDGKPGGIDGKNGHFYLNPEDYVVNLLKAGMEYSDEEELRELVGLPDITKSGQKLYVLANVNDLWDCRLAMSNDAYGVGLYRTEFDFMKSSSMPTEEELYDIYRRAVQIVDGKPIIFRLADFTEDKLPSYIPKEEMAKGDWCNIQISALLRVAVHGDVRILIPRVKSEKDFGTFKSGICMNSEHLFLKKKKNKVPPVGAMIENPKALDDLGLIATEADFLCVGTNDLMRYYTEIYHDFTEDCCKEDVYKTVETVVKFAHLRKKWVGVCGEMAAEPESLKYFLEAGVDVISVIPKEVLPMRRHIRNTD